MTKNILLILTFVSMITVVNQDFASYRRNPQSVVTVEESQSNTPLSDYVHETKVFFAFADVVITTSFAIATGIIFGPFAAIPIVCIGLIFLAGIVLS
jgi:hypothetical protein